MNGSPTTMELKKKPHLEWEEGWRCGTCWFHTHMSWIKIRRDIAGARAPSPIPGPLAQGFSARKISPHNIWL